MPAPRSTAPQPPRPRHPAARPPLAGFRPDPRSRTSKPQTGSRSPPISGPHTASHPSGTSRQTATTAACAQAIPLSTSVPGPAGCPGRLCPGAGDCNHSGPTGPGDTRHPAVLTIPLPPHANHNYDNHQPDPARNGGKQTKHSGNHPSEDAQESTEGDEHHERKEQGYKTAAAGKEGFVHVFPEGGSLGCPFGLDRLTIWPPSATGGSQRPNLQYTYAGRTGQVARHLSKTMTGLHSVLSAFPNPTGH